MIFVSRTRVQYSHQGRLDIPQLSAAAVRSIKKNKLPSSWVCFQRQLRRLITSRCKRLNGRIFHVTIAIFGCWDYIILTTMCHHFNQHCCVSLLAGMSFCILVATVWYLQHMHHMTQTDTGRCMAGCGSSAGSLYMTYFLHVSVDEQPLTFILEGFFFFLICERMSNLYRNCISAKSTYKWLTFSRIMLWWWEVIFRIQQLPR